jgi:cellulose synthase/poly-beta-1,6-N-acetylglucosamine synthase-like glycosyltransferase
MYAVLVIAVVLAAASAGELVAWTLFALRAWKEWRRSPFVQEGLEGTPVPLPPLTVVIPAHNEERVAAACARSVLASDYPALELVFVLDRCTDGTRRELEPIAAADPRLVIVDNGSCPPDWAGKCNAARVGASRARGELVLFADADTRFDPRLLRAAVTLLRRRRLAMLSLWSTPTLDLWFERVVQPVTALMMLKLFPMRRVDGRLRRRSFANGQFMLFERTAYEAFGGHAAVKDDLLEDLAFARGMRRRGFEQDAAVADGMLSVSMYATWDAFRTGWKRIFIESCMRNPSRLRHQAAQLASIALVLPALRTASGLMAGAALLWGGASLDAGDHRFAVATVAAAVAAALWRGMVLMGVYRLSGFPAWAGLLFTLAGASVVRIFLDGARDLHARVPVRWGGRQYVLEPTRH